MSASTPWNSKKYEGAAKNPLVGLLVWNFFRTIGSLWPSEVSSVLDAGCGAGHALHRLASFLPDDVIGIDLDDNEVKICQQRFPEYVFLRADIGELPFEDDQFDLVLCLEVLEHLESPSKALRELERVSARWVILSVPFEPWFQLGSLLRGKYLRTLGNHPEHIQHWNRRTFCDFIEKHSDMKVRRCLVAFPWVAVLCQAPAVR